MSILIRCEAVDFYAARVRAELSGVDPEVIDDLTDGLEADLTESILDGLPEDDEASSYLTTLEIDALAQQPGHAANTLGNAALAGACAPAQHRAAAEEKRQSEKRLAYQAQWCTAAL